MLRILAGLLFLATLVGAASAADYYGGAAPAAAPPVYHYGALPECGEPAVLARISDRFAYQDAHITFTGLTIDHIDGVSQRALKVGGPGLIDRRYCGGQAWLSNGSATEVVFLIEGPKLGTFSIDWHVESCLAGHDPWHVYDARCRSIRP